MPVTVTIEWREFLLPKRGNSATECEDAISCNLKKRRFAVADGASESYAAGDWARLLCKHYVEDGLGPEWLVEPRVAWQEAVAGRAVPWYAEDKIGQGGHATFLGLTLSEGKWLATAAGDACLFMIRNGAMETSFPIASSDAFNGSPVLVRTWGEDPIWEFGLGDLKLGDTLLLATDALAQMILSSHEADAFIGPQLAGMTSTAQFEDWVVEARKVGKLRNDDVALGVVRVVGPK